MIYEHLESGLTVIVKPVPNKVVTIDAWVNTGSANEDGSNSGISHFLEHMMFKGTPKYGPGELDKTITSVGGVWNAGTSKDFTHYYVTVAAPFFATALDAISDMLQNSLIPTGEFDREKQVILEEYRRKQDSPVGVLYDELYDVCFEQGPYKQTVIGTFDSISALGRDQMFDYYKRYYTPRNIVLLVVGDVEPQDALRQISEAFAGFAKDLSSQNGDSANSRFVGGASRTLERDINETYLALCYPAPPITSGSEVFATEIASTILGDGRSSRLYQRLKEEKGIAHSISAGFPTHKHESLFYVMATLDAADSNAVMQETRVVLNELATNPPSKAEIAKAKRIIRNSFQFGTETNTGQSATIGYYFTITGSPKFLDNYLENLAGVTSEQVSETVGKYLSGPPSTVTVKPRSNGAHAEKPRSSQTQTEPQ